MYEHAGVFRARQRSHASAEMTLPLPASARALIESAPLAHLVSVNSDGSPQVTCVWIGLDGERVYFASLMELQKIRNLQRDNRVVISIESPTWAARGVQEYLVLYGTAEVAAGGAPAALQQLAHKYIGPDAIFPNMADPPPGFIVRITVDRIRGVGPWMEGK
jgi:PPOX class probable F420-dependent enzyme